MASPACQAAGLAGLAGPDRPGSAHKTWGVTPPVASEGDNSRGGAKGDAPGRVREGGTPPAQLGGMGERCELPPSGSGAEPQKPTLFAFKKLQNSKNYTNTRRPRKRPRPLFYMYAKPPTKKNGSCLNERIVVIINASALPVSTFKKWCSNKILKNGAQDYDNTLVQTIDSLN